MFALTIPTVACHCFYWLDGHQDDKQLALTLTSRSVMFISIILCCIFINVKQTKFCS